MPPGNARPKPTARILERTTAETCLAIARRVQTACQGSGDLVGLAAAREIAESIRREVVDAAPALSLGSSSPG